jgi:cardiolipin synthase
MFDGYLSYTEMSLIGLAVVAFFENFGIVAAGHAILRSRTSQGAIAWALLLLILPYVAVPLYLVLGRSRFYGYVTVRRAGNQRLVDVVSEAGAKARAVGLIKEESHPEHAALEELAMMRFTHQNKLRLLIDGEATFGAIFDAIDAAGDYLLVQFFIIHDDELGRELKDRLIVAAQRGVRVYLLYDEVGSHGLPRSYARQLTDAGAEVRPFHSTRGPSNRFQLNFRNHRKIVVADGRKAYVGGLNVGDEYMGRSKKFGPWRDTHLEIIGPAVHATQLAFLEDWHWATGEVPDLDWNPRAAEGGDQSVLILPSGPADELETCGLFFIHAMNVAKKRLWIASPYFVPDIHVIAALQLAALRGVDVRVMLPRKPDHMLVYLSSFSFLEEAERAGMKVYRYQRGFMHQKALVVDDCLAAVGTANLDNRSFRLNFEITAITDDPKFAGEVAEMFERDFAECEQVGPEDLEDRSFWFKLGVRISRLMAPIQ